jgi:hypothetical protein
MLRLQKRWSDLLQPKSLPLRQQRLGDHWAEYLQDRVRYAILVTIQPNFDWGGPCHVRAVQSSSSAFPNADNLWDLIKTIFFRLDCFYNSISNAAYLPSRARFQGVGILEKHRDNVHCHLFLNCLNPTDQFFRSLLLLELLDNVVKDRNDDRDDRWQREAWELITAKGGWSEDPSWTRTSSILAPLAPAGTAMVQLVRTDEDRAKVCRYITKTWNDSIASLADRRSVGCYDPAQDCRELDEFHSDIGRTAPARYYRIDPATGSLSLDFDKPIVWKQRGRVVR